jgi:ribosomal protein S27E
MASWVLQCGNCKVVFAHSQIDDRSILNYYIPEKPDFPSGGILLECPSCGTRATYQLAELSYRA